MLDEQQVKNKVTIKDLWNKSDTKAFSISLVFIVLWFLFESYFLEKFNHYIVEKFLSKATNNTFFFWVVLFGLLFFLFFRCKNYFRNKIFIPYKYLIFASTFVVMHLIYRFQNMYIYYPSYYGFSILDLVSLYVIGFIGMAHCFNLGKGVKQKSKDGFTFYSDKPLGKGYDKDVLGFSYTVNEFYNTLKNTIFENELGLSIGITGKWGEGKSSFIYLLQEHFKKEQDRFIVLEFNPRHAKSEGNIQFDFFQMLYEEMSKYDIRFSSSFSNYLKAIQVIDSAKMFDFLKEGHNAFFAKESEKERVNKAIKRINKSVIVFIDDFDRLLPNEIIEVCKLIDGNASFDGVFFITAFDKEYVKSVLKKDFEYGTGDFIDKFFTIEKPLPYIPETAYTEYLVSELKENFGDLITEEFIKEITKYGRTNISTLRDCKRFLNRFVDEYRNKRRGVDFVDFFLLSLIEYRWKDYYNAIREMKIVNVHKSGHTILRHSVMALESHKLYILQDWESNLQKTLSIDVDDKDTKVPIDKNFEVLFFALFKYNSNNLLKGISITSNGMTIKNEDLAINNVTIFDNYFMPYVNKLANPLTIEHIFSNDENENILLINRFFDEGQSGYLINYLSRKRTELIKSEKDLIRFIEVVIYVLNIKNDFNLKATLRAIICSEDFDNLSKLNVIKDKEVCKKEITKKLVGAYPDSPYDFVGSLLKEEVGKNKKLGDRYKTSLIFSNEELLNINMKVLEDLIENEPIYNETHLDVLSTCLEFITSKEKNGSYLNEKACGWVKELIIKNPKIYLDNFVRLEQQIISIEYYCNQIFGSYEDVNQFLNQIFTGYEVNKKELIHNVWKLITYNNYKYIDLDFDSSDLEEMAKDNFTREIDKIDKVVLLKKEFESLQLMYADIFNIIRKFEVSPISGIVFCRSFVGFEISLERILACVVSIKGISDGVYGIDAMNVDLVERMKKLPLEELKLNYGSSGIDEAVLFLESKIKNIINEAEGYLKEVSNWSYIIGKTVKRDINEIKLRFDVLKIDVSLASEYGVVNINNLKLSVVIVGEEEDIEVESIFFCGSIKYVLNENLDLLSPLSVIEITEIK